MDVAIQVPAFDEGESMRATLESIKDQSVPSYVDALSLEVWVTPTTNHAEDDETWQVAASTPGFEPFEAPQYKLPTRNAAHDSAVDAGFDVIATWDADAPPLSDGTLAALLDPFQHDNADAVRGNPRSPWKTPFGISTNIARALLVRPLFNHMHGQLSAFTADAWLCAGPFDESIDHTSLKSVWDEEEVDFARRLRECGKFVHAGGALVHNDNRRMHCRFQKAFEFSGRHVSDWCDSRGVETFQTEDEEDDWDY